MTVEQNPWSFVGRREQVEQISSRLLSGSGVLVVGEAGVGKTALAQQALLSITGSAHILRVRGTAAVSQIPYGSLGVLLSELDDQNLDHPIAVLRGLTRHLTEQSKDEPIILFVDNSHDVDAQSAMVIAQLAAQGTVRLLSVCESLPETPQEFVQLWKDGLLHRVDVERMSLAETHHVLREELQGPISRSVLQELWRATAGNPLYLRALTREQVADGNLVRREGGWVLLTKAAVQRGRLADVLLARLNRLGEEQRSLIELVSLAEALPLELLIAVAPLGDVDALQERGTVDVDDRPDHMVRMRSSLVAEVVRANVPPGRSCVLRERLLAAHQGSGIPPVDVVAFAMWTLNCGAHLDQTLALTAARAANARNNPEAALRFLDAAVPDPAAPELAGERVRALIAQGRIDQARTLIERAPAAGGQMSLTQAAELVLARSGLALSDEQTAAAARKGLRRMRSRLQAFGEGGSNSQIDELLARIEFALVELAVYEGRYGDVLNTLDEMFRNSSYPAAVRRSAGIWLSAAWAMTGRQDDGVQLAREIVGMTENGRDSTPGASAEGQLLHSFLLAGQWKECSEILRRRRSPEVSLDGDDAVTDELIEAMLHAYCGRADEALELLLPALGQLRERDVHGLLLLALALTAYAHSIRHEAATVRRLLREMEDCSGYVSWQVHRAARFFADLASVVLTSKAEAARRLMRHADEERSSGAVSYELFLLSSAVRLGEHDAASRLVSVAATAQGPFARLCAQFGRGIAAGDAAALLNAARMAESMGHVQWCRDAAEAAEDCAAAAGQLETASAAQRLADACANSLYRPARTAAEQLTSRERDIARRAAAGATNKAIAEDLSVSVRTVEGHLYQIYGKLRVRSRVELDSTVV